MGNYISANAAIFNDDLSEDFRRDLVRMVLAEHQLSHDECFGSYPYPEAHYLWPHRRRVGMEVGLRTVAERHGLPAIPEPFEKNGDFYSVVKTERVLCTISHMQERRGLPRDARARETTAQDSDPTLFEETPPPKDAKLYAIIVYGGSSEDSNTPAFVDVIFPSRDYTWVVERIRLLDWFMDDHGEGSTEIENIPDFGGPTIRTQPDVDE